MFFKLKFCTIKNILIDLNILIVKQYNIFNLKMSFNKKKAILEEYSDINRISNMKSNNNNNSINLKQEYLNIKRKRGKDIEKEEKDDSNETHTETRDTIFRKRINEKEITISDSPENNLEINNKNAKKLQNNKKRLNRFMRKKREHFIKLREESRKIFL